MPKYSLKVTNRITGKEVENMEILNNTHLFVGCDYEDVAIQGDGTPIVCNKCGEFDYLDLEKYSVVFKVEFDDD